jgi:hypothetical protein
MHHGYLVADLPWPMLSALLQQRAGRFEDRGAIDLIETVPTQSTDEGWWLAAGEYADHAYVLDYSWQLSGADAPDLVAGLAAESGALVIGCGAETVSGSYYLVAARGRQVLRHYYALPLEPDRAL